MITCEIDFAIDGYDATREVEMWRDEFAPNCTVEVIDATANTRNSMVTVHLAAASSRVLHDALLTYFGGDNESALEILRDAQVDA